MKKPAKNKKKNVKVDCRVPANDDMKYYTIVDKDDPRLIGRRCVGFSCFGGKGYIHYAGNFVVSNTDDKETR